MDNLSSHKIAGVRQAIEAAGASQRFLPAYSPDLDPIEQVFAKLKNALRKMARRTVDALWDAIGIALNDFRRLGFGPAEAWCRKAPYLANIDAIDFAVPIRRTAPPSASTRGVAASSSARSFAQP